MNAAVMMTSLRCPRMKDGCNTTRVGRNAERVANDARLKPAAIHTKRPVRLRVMRPDSPRPNARNAPRGRRIHATSDRRTQGPAVWVGPLGPGVVTLERDR